MGNALMRKDPKLKQITEYKFVRKKFGEYPISSVVILEDERLAIGECNGLIHVFDIYNNFYKDMVIDTKLKIKVLTALSDNKLLIFSKYNVITIYSIFILTYSCTFSIAVQEDFIINKVISLSNGRFAFPTNILHGDNPGIQIWSCRNTYKLIKILRKHIFGIDSIYHLKKKEKLISFSLEVIIWNLQSYQCETIINYCETIMDNSGIEELNNNTLIIEGIDYLIFLNLLNYKKKIVKIKDKFMRFYSFLQINDNIVLCGDDSFLYAVNIETESFLKIQFPYLSVIYNLYQLKNKTYVIVSNNLVFFGEKNNEYLYDIEKNFKDFDKNRFINNND